MKKHALVALAALCLSVPLFGQGPIKLPEASPAATVGQTIGITDVEVIYHRPAVNKRKIFGGLVPFDTIWRTGANENTTISFSTPVKVEGKDVPAGTYAFYAIPGTSQWTIVLSKFTGDWGVYNYDPAEDLARATVTPQAMNDSQERLSYSFDDVTNSSGVLSLRWEKTRVPVKIDVDLPTTIRASISSTLRGNKHWDPSAYAAAARWELRNGDVETANKYADRALELQTSTSTLRTKAAILEKKGDKKGADDLRARAATMFNEPEAIGFAYGPLVNQKKYDEAITWINGYIAAHPTTTQLWRLYSGLGEAYAAKGDAAKAKESFDKAMAAAHDQAERTEVWDSINSVAAEVK
jgi:Flp pilus assembly protein TadD